ncbi:MAG: TetR/AcrR family transcriptional regulator [Clostridia bacterium]|nr:TetR/AcrR family transcriptional regulator [Clostridia bacterium]
MYHISTDKREHKSADALVAAAERIILDTDPQKLTVSLLSKEAGVSRSTFYRLFDEPDDVLQYGADRVFDGMVAGYVALIERSEKHDLAVPAPTLWYEEAFRKNAAVIAAMYRIGKSDILGNAHKAALRTFASVLYPDLDPASDEFRFFVAMRTAVLMGAVSAWVETGQKLSVADIEKYAARQLNHLAGV